jgi:enamine deaminase RidA (YjgF/YER057c/UK114 family)
MTRPNGQRILLPAGWPQPKGYANGVVARGTQIFLGGQIGWDEQGRFAEGFAGQVRRALENIVCLLREAGAGPEHVVRLTWFVTDMNAYSRSLREIGEAYRSLFGRHYPSMSLVQVVRLVEARAQVEIEATAILPD